MTTCSFHATKLFHTVEGGCIISDNDELKKKLSLYRSFGHIADDYHSVGINGKNSEFHAAMGLAVLPQVPAIIAERKIIFETYNALMPGCIRRPSYHLAGFEYNYSYYPVIFESEKLMQSAKEALQKNNVHARRYFYPSLNLLPHISGIKTSCPISEDISSRILCLPLYPGLQESEIAMIVSVIINSIK